MKANKGLISGLLGIALLAMPITVAAQDGTRFDRQSAPGIVQIHDHDGWRHFHHHDRDDDDWYRGRRFDRDDYRWGYRQYYRPYYRDRDDYRWTNRWYRDRDDYPYRGRYYRDSYAPDRFVSTYNL
jgi:hypothetical protein